GVEQLASGSHTHRYWTAVQNSDPIRVATLNLENLAFLALFVALTVIAWRRFGAPYGLFATLSLAIPLSVPSSRWPLLSIPRFGLTIFPLFLALAVVAADRPGRRGAPQHPVRARARQARGPRRRQPRRPAAGRPHPPRAPGPDRRFRRSRPARPGAGARGDPRCGLRRGGRVAPLRRGRDRRHRPAHRKAGRRAAPERLARADTPPGRRAPQRLPLGLDLRRPRRLHNRLVSRPHRRPDRQGRRPERRRAGAGAGAVPAQAPPAARPRGICR